MDLIMEHFKVIATLQRQGDDFANPDSVFSNGRVHELEEDRMTRQVSFDFFSFSSPFLFSLSFRSSLRVFSKKEGKEGSLMRE